MLAYPDWPSPVLPASDCPATRRYRPLANSNLLRPGGRHVDPAWPTNIRPQTRPSHLVAALVGSLYDNKRSCLLSRPVDCLVGYLWPSSDKSVPSHSLHSISDSAFGQISEFSEIRRLKFYNRYVGFNEALLRIFVNRVIRMKSKPFIFTKSDFFSLSGSIAVAQSTHYKSA